MAPEATNPPEPVTIRSTGGAELKGQLVRSSTADRRKAVAVLFLHGFPSADLWADKIGNDMPELCRRIADDQDWNALSIHFRGCGESSGDFSLARWVDDASTAIRYLRAETNPSGLWVCGFGTGGAVGLVAAADDPSVSGVAVAASPADFDDWAAAPDRLLAHAREVRAITTNGFPQNVERWNEELTEVRAVAAAEVLAPRPLLVLHGAEDEAVPNFDARLVADAHGSADLRMIPGAGHDLRHDPRAVAVLLGWLTRQSMDLIDG